MLVLKWFLAALRAQFYVGGDVDASIKKPLNAFLGELFIASWKDEDGLESNIVTEQVRSVKTLISSAAKNKILQEDSHHPPITALHMWNEQHGIRVSETFHVFDPELINHSCKGTGYSRVEMTFAGSINIKQTGHAQLHIDKYDEDYLIPLPDMKVKGFLSGTLYPELSGVYYIVSSSGLVSEVSFNGKGLFGGGVRNTFIAAVYLKGDETKTSLYEARGSWSDKFTMFDARTGAEIEGWDTSAPTAPLRINEVSKQDAWETRKAWQYVLAPLQKGDLSTTIAEKSRLEEAQRAMREKEKSGLEAPFKPLFFAPQAGGDPLFESLAKGTGWLLQSERTKGVWRYDTEKAKNLRKPYHGNLTPFG